MIATLNEKRESHEPEMPAAQSVSGQSEHRSSVNTQFALALTLAAYCGVILVGVSHHEPWADEAQAWLLSRDLPYRYLVFHQIAYDGVPPLWPSILWVASHWLHLPYASMNWIGGICAIAGCWFFCRYSPFPLWVRVLFPFTYFMAFQYAVVARPYVLLPLCVFAAAHYFADAERRPWRFIGAVSALSLLCAHGLMIAVGLVAARVCYSFRTWSQLAPAPKKKLFAALIVFALVLAFVAFINWPPSDYMFARLDRPVRNGENFGFGILPRDLSVAFLGSAIPSAMFLAVVGAWCACRRRFLPFVLPMVLVLGFCVRVFGNLWHGGALTLAAMAALWIAWPLPGKCSPQLQRGLNLLLLVGLACLLAIQIYWAGSTLAMDYSHPYSGSLDAANFLHSVGADARSTCAFTFYSVAIQPYFPENIFENWPPGEAFWRWQQGNRNDLNCTQVKWVVVPNASSLPVAQSWFQEKDRALRSFGYVPAHVSPGSMFFEGRVVDPADFIIYESPQWPTAPGEPAEK